MKRQYKIERPDGRSERFTNMRKADKRVRDLSRETGGLHFLAVLKNDSPESHPQGRWEVINRYKRGHVTLYGS